MQISFFTKKAEKDLINSRAIVQNTFMVTTNSSKSLKTSFLGYISNMQYLVHKVVFKRLFHTSMYVVKFGIPTTHNFHNLTKKHAFRNLGLLYKEHTTKVFRTFE